MHSLECIASVLLVGIMEGDKFDCSLVLAVKILKHKNGGNRMEPEENLQRHHANRRNIGAVHVKLNKWQDLVPCVAHAFESGASNLDNDMILPFNLAIRMGSICSG